MEVLYLAVIGIVAYFASDRILQAIEARLGRRFAQREVVFLLVMLAITLAAFALVRALLER